ncbi:MAG: hypothetical protein GQ570_12150 [Helicobacteraceae bacterium]|nr:hypothetical protein [Helicobacteraceae bacterium]
MARIYKRHDGVLDWEESGQDRLQLPRNYHVTHLLCKYTVTHTNAANAVFNDDNLFASINKVEIVGNGNKNLKSIKGTKLALNTILSSTMMPKKVLDTTEGTGKVSEVWFLIPYSMFGTIRGHDTILNTTHYTTLDLLIDFGNKNAVGTNIEITAAKINVYSNALIGYKRNPGEVVKFFKETQTVEPIVNTADEHTITLPTLKLFKQFALVSTVDGVRSDAVIKNVIIKSGTTIILNVPYAALQVENLMQFKPEDKTDLKGVCIVDFMPRGFMTDCLDTRTNEFNTLELVLSVEKIGTKTDVTIFTDEIEITNIVEA